MSESSRGLRRPLRALIIAILFCIALTPAVASADPLALVDESEQIGPGIQYDHTKYLDEAGWWEQYVLEIDLSNGAVTSDVVSPDYLTQTQAVGEMADRAGAVAAVNGDYSDPADSRAASGAVVKNGVLQKSADATPLNHVGVGKDGIGRMVNMAVDARATLNGVEHSILTLNTSNFYGTVPDDAMLAYTTPWGTFSRARGMNGATDIAEVLVQNDQVVSVNPDGATGGEIPENGFYLVGKGAEATAIRALQVGDPVSLVYGLSDEIAQQMHFALGAHRLLVQDGVARPDGELDNDLHPRTAIGFKDGGRTMILMGVDGRQTQMAGATLRHMAAMMVQRGAEFAFNMDGGGSTTVVARHLGDDKVTLRNTPSDGYQRLVSNGIGVFVTPGSGVAEKLVVTPGEARVFPGLSRTLTAKAVDDHLTPVAISRGDVRWTSDEGAIQGGLLRAPEDAEGEIAVRSITDTAQADTEVRVLGDVRDVELSASRLSFTGADATAQTLAVTGRDAEGFAAPIEAVDLDLEYDESVVHVSPSGTGLKVTPVSSGGTVLTINVDGQQTKLPISVGVETVSIADFDREDELTHWGTNGTAGMTRTLSMNADGMVLDYTAGRNMGITPVGGPIDIPGQPLLIRMRMKSTVPVSLTYISMRDADGVSKAVYGPPLVPGEWQDVVFPVPADVKFPLRYSQFQAIETNVGQQAPGSITFDRIEVDVPSEVEIPETEPLKSDSLISPDGTVSDEEDWHFATMSDVQFTASNPELAKSGIAALKRIRQTEPDMVVLNGDITDLGQPADLTLARQTLEAGGCDLIKPGEEPAVESTPDYDNPETKMPCYYVPGNHESYLPSGQGTLDAFVAEFGQPYRTFDHKGTRMILLNSTLGSLRGSDFAQLPMMQQALESAEADESIDNVMVFAHHPVDDPAETKASELTDRTEVQLIKKMLADFREDSGKGVAMVGSHAQIANVNRFEGVPYIVLPTIGKNPYGTPDRGGITGFFRFSMDRDADAAEQWLTADVRAFAQEINLEVPETLEVGTESTLSGSIVQPEGIQSGSRVVPLRYPMSVHWSGSDSLEIGSGEEAIDAARAAGKVAILDPATRELTALRQGSVDVSVTNESMREYTDDSSLTPITATKTIAVTPWSGPGPRLSVEAPVFTAQPVGTISSGQWITVSNPGDEDLVIDSLELKAGSRDSAGEFMLSDDNCSTGAIAPGGECEVLVRFAPRQADATSTAELVMSANTADRRHVLELSATSVEMPSEVGPEGPAGPEGPSGPEGPAGPSGPEGPAGPSGPEGPAGQDGANGENGTDGKDGVNGTNGVNGVDGKPGPAGQQGPEGPRGQQGPKGKDGKVTVKCELVNKGRSIRCSVQAKGSKQSAKRMSVRIASAGSSKKATGKGGVLLQLNANKRIKSGSRVRLTVNNGGANDTVTFQVGSRGKLKVVNGSN